MAAKRTAKYSSHTPAHRIWQEATPTAVIFISFGVVSQLRTLSGMHAVCYAVWTVCNLANHSKFWLEITLCIWSLDIQNGTSKFVLKLLQQALK
jgi:hypothetical protein